jgi:hypothetical protein
MLVVRVLCLTRRHIEKSRTNRDVTSFIKIATCSVLQHAIMQALDKVEMVDSQASVNTVIDDDAENAFDQYICLEN